jgi:hypothetical protein
MARTTCAVERRAQSRDSVERGLSYRVLLRVQRPNAAPVFEQAPNFRAMFLARRRAVVTCCQYSLLSNKHCAHMPPRTRAPRRDFSGYREKILIPRWTGHTYPPAPFSGRSFLAGEEGCRCCRKPLSHTQRVPTCERLGEAGTHLRVGRGSTRAGSGGTGL